MRELTDADGKQPAQRKIEPIFESAAYGNFEIPPTIKNSRLHFRAYTTWMMNLKYRIYL